jgi:hypothetical protein
MKEFGSMWAEGDDPPHLQLPLKEIIEMNLLSHESRSIGLAC